MAASEEFARFADTVAGVLFRPRVTFHMLACQARVDLSRLWEAAALVIAVATLDGMRLAWASTSGPLVLASVISAQWTALFLWIPVVAVPALIDTAAGRGLSRARSFMVLSGWSFLPWLFTAPFSLFYLSLGSWFVVFTAAVMFAQMVYLFFLAVREVFHVTSEQVFYFVIVVPQVASIALAFWIGQVVSEALSLMF